MCRPRCAARVSSQSWACLRGALTFVVRLSLTGSARTGSFWILGHLKQAPARECSLVHRRPEDAIAPGQLLMAGGKRCPKCGETKPVSAFGKDARQKSGLRIWCKFCHATAQRERKRLAGALPRIPR